MFSIYCYLYWKKLAYLFDNMESPKVTGFISLDLFYSSQDIIRIGQSEKAMFSPLRRLSVYQIYCLE